jgi:hypothetical protein
LYRCAQISSALLERAAQDQEGRLKTGRQDEILPHKTAGGRGGI